MQYWVCLSISFGHGVQRGPFAIEPFRGLAAASPPKRGILGLGWDLQALVSGYHPPASYPPSSNAYQAPLLFPY